MKSTTYDVINYDISSILMLLSLYQIQIFSYALCSETPSSFRMRDKASHTLKQQAK